MHVIYRIKRIRGKFTMNCSVIYNSRQTSSSGIFLSISYKQKNNNRIMRQQFLQTRIKSLDVEISFQPEYISPKRTLSAEKLLYLEM